MVALEYIMGLLEGFTLWRPQTGGYHFFSENKESELMKFFVRLSVCLFI